MATNSKTTPARTSAPAYVPDTLEVPCIVRRTSRAGNEYISAEIWLVDRNGVKAPKATGSHVWADSVARIRELTQALDDSALGALDEHGQIRTEDDTAAHLIATYVSAPAVAPVTVAPVAPADSEYAEFLAWRAAHAAPVVAPVAPARKSGSLADAARARLNASKNS